MRSSPCVDASKVGAMAKGQSIQNEKIAVLGASRGLGREFVHALAQGSTDVDLFLTSRKEESLRGLAEEVRGSFRSVRVEAYDFSKPGEQEGLLELLWDWNPDRLIYLAGGGPHGEFFQKNWRDHQWALEVSFLFPARLLHRFRDVRQLAFVGSAVAENSTNNLSSSYGASKVALRNLLGAVVEENPKLDVRLLSPGYMDTELLPEGSWPRENSDILDPREVAALFLQWLSQPKSGWQKSVTCIS